MTLRVRTDFSAAVTDVAATGALAAVAVVTQVWWFWPVAAGWGYVGYRQVRIVRRTRKRTDE